MLVKVEDKCSRCHKGPEREVEHTELPQLAEVPEKREAALVAFQKLLDQSGVAKHQDVIVVLKGKVYNIDFACDKCIETIQNHVDAIFKLKKPKPRNAVSKAPKGVAAPKEAAT